MVGGRMLSWPIILVLCAGREVMCGKKREREWEEREWNRYSSERVENSKMNKFLGGAKWRTFTHHELSLHPNPGHIFCLSQF